MRRLLVLLTLLCPFSLEAQNPTLVTGTLIDPNSVPYYPATVTTCLTPTTVDPVVNGIHVNTNLGANYCAGPVPTTSTGTFGPLPLFPNSAITPGGTQYIFTVEVSGTAPPAGFGSLKFSSAAVTVSGTSQDVSANINAVGTAQLRANGSGTTSVINAKDYTTFSASVRWDCSWTSGSAAIICPSGTFTSSDVNKVAWATNLPPTGFTAMNGTLSCPKTTILSFQSSTQVTLVANCTANSAASNPFVYGPDETTGVNNWLTTVINACGTGVTPVGKAIWSAPPQTAPPTTNCVNTNGAERGGLVIQGQGVGNSQLIPTPDFDFTKCTNGNGTACLGAAGGTSRGGWNFYNWSIWGSGVGNPTVAAAHNFIELNFGSSMLNFSALAFGAGAPNMTGLVVLGTPVSIVNVQIDGFGAIGCDFNPGGTGLTITQSYCGDNLNGNVIVRNPIYASQNIWGPTLAGVAKNIVQVEAGGVFTSTDDSWLPSGATSPTCLALTTATSTAFVDKALMNSCSTALFLQTAGATATIAKSRLGGSVQAILRSGGTVYDNGGNIYTGSVSSIAPTCAFTSGGGTTPSCSLQAGSTNEKGTIIATTGTGAPGTTGTVTLTFAGTYSGATGATPSCTYTPNDSGTAWGNGALVRISTQSTTAPVLVWSNSVNNVLTALTISSPYRIDYVCVAR